MAQITSPKVLVQGADIKAFTLRDTSVVRKAIEQTKQMQMDVLKQKDVDQDRLKMIVQL